MARIAFVFAGQGAQAPGMGRSLAEASPAAAEVFRRVEPGDALLLCSDGLSNLLFAPELLREITRGEQDSCCERMVHLAKERGAPDNVTAVLVTLD